MIDVLKTTEEEVQQKTGDKNAVLPVDKKGADILYAALAGTHTILPAAIIFNQAKKDWTLSLFEAANYGYFLGDSSKAKEVADRIVKEARRLKVKEVIITECGHAYRVMKFLYEAWAKEKLPFKVTGIVEAISSYLDEGLITLKPGSFKDPVTYHDPCQVGRNAGFFDEPRKIMNIVAKDFREMTPHREKVDRQSNQNRRVVAALPSVHSMAVHDEAITLGDVSGVHGRVVQKPIFPCHVVNNNGF